MPFEDVREGPRPPAAGESAASAFFLGSNTEERSLTEAESKYVFP